jgi:hypothetical protein
MSLVRQIVFSISDEGGGSVTGFYSWDSVMDNNADGKMFTCGYSPDKKSDVISVSQSSVFVGTKDAGLVIEAFKRGVAQDNGVNVDARAITNPIVLTDEQNEPYEVCRFLSLETLDINGLEGGVVLQYAIDAKAPQRISPAWINAHYSPGKSRAFFPQGIARWLHLQILDSTGVVDEEVFGPFAIEFYQIGSRDGESTRR